MELLLLFSFENEAKTQLKLVTMSESYQTHILDGQKSAIILHRGFQPLIPNMCNTNLTRKNKHFQCMCYQFFNHIIVGHINQNNKSIFE